MSNRNILEVIIARMAHELRVRRRESYYVTAKDSNLRAETIKKIEDFAGGNFSSVDAYMTSFCRRFPSVAYSIFYNAALEAAQQNMFEDDTETKL